MNENKRKQSLVTNEPVRLFPFWRFSLALISKECFFFGWEINFCFWTHVVCSSSAAVQSQEMMLAAENELRVCGQKSVEDLSRQYFFRAAITRFLCRTYKYRPHRATQHLTHAFSYPPDRASVYLEPPDNSSWFCIMLPIFFFFFASTPRLVVVWNFVQILCA